MRNNVATFIFSRKENGQSKSLIAAHGHTRVALHSCALYSILRGACRRAASSDSHHLTSSVLQPITSGNIQASNASPETWLRMKASQVTAPEARITLERSTADVSQQCRDMVAAPKSSGGHKCLENTCHTFSPRLDQKYS
ncbi:hypothetical protein KC345_g207 [Hortaea werneckii]|nr:hypothetical protein KC345_g207 [Hortaea werneckii]